MNSFTITSHLEIVFEIKGYSDYIVVKGGDIYNIKTGYKLKKTLNGGYTKGVWFGKKFITEHKLKPLLTKVIKTNCPF